MAVVTYPDALYLIEPAETDPGDRDFGFEVREDDKYDLIQWQSLAHSQTPTQKEVDKAESLYLEQGGLDSDSSEELLGIPLELLQEAMPPAQPYPYVFAANDDQIPELFAGRRFYHMPSSKEYFGFQPDPKTPGEWWSEPIWDGGGYNGNCSVNRQLRRFNGQSQTTESGIPVEEGIYRILSLEACWHGYQNSPAIEILRGRVGIALANKGSNYHLSQHFDPKDQKWIFKMDSRENIWMRWRGRGTVRFPQARIQFRRVLLP